MNYPQRKPLRLNNYDYSLNGCYFITICTHNKKSLFGKIENGNMVLNKNGLIAEENFKKIDLLYKNISVDTFVVMPNHVHAIIRISNDISGIEAGIQKEDNKNISGIIQSYKSAVTKEIRWPGESNQSKYNEDEFPNVLKNTNEKIWQKSFYDHIIRSEEDYINIFEYIQLNPQRWETDCMYNL